MRGQARSSDVRAEYLPDAKTTCAIRPRRLPMSLRPPERWIDRHVTRYHYRMTLRPLPARSRESDTVLARPDLPDRDFCPGFAEAVRTWLSAAVDGRCNSSVPEPYAHVHTVMSSSDLPPALHTAIQQGVPHFLIRVAVPKPPTNRTQLNYPGIKLPRKSKPRLGSMSILGVATLFPSGCRRWSPVQPIHPDEHIKQSL